MIDINEQLERDLQDIGVDVMYYYPEALKTLPIVTYYNISEKGYASYDNTEAITYGAVQIDIWVRNNPAQTGRIAAKIKECLCNKGWVRETALDVPSGEDGVYHRTMRFSKIF